VSILTDFFLADEAEAAASVAEGPSGHLPTVETNGVDPIKLATLHGILTGRDYSLDAAFDQLLAEVQEVTAEGDEGPWVYVVPDGLVAALRSASAERVAEVAVEWAETDEWKLDGVPADDLGPLLDDLADLARRAKPPKRLHLWMSL
jgi:hypothetical protein